MELPKNKLPDKVIIFFQKLKEYINSPIMFYGSVQRDDYIPGKSDIDIDIFSENDISTIHKIVHYLQLPRERFKRIIWKTPSEPTLIMGYKLVYKIPTTDVSIEMSVYDEKYKSIVSEQHRNKTVLPVIATILLLILKVFYYILRVISGDSFRFFKRNILNIFSGFRGEDLFTVI
jgi:hypothetical protein